MDNEITRLFCLHIMCPHFLYDGTGGVLIRVIQNLPRALTLKHQFTVVVQKNQRITFREWEKYFLGRKENILFLSLVCGAASAHRTSEKGKVLKAFPLNAASARSVLRRSRKRSGQRAEPKTQTADNIFRRAALHQIHCFLLDDTESCRKPPPSCCEEPARAEEEPNAALFAPVPGNTPHETLNSQINTFGSTVRSVHFKPEMKAGAALPPGPRGRDGKNYKPPGVRF